MVQLAHNVASPTEHLALRRDAEGVCAAASDPRRRLALQRHFVRLLLPGPVLSVEAPPELTVVVVPPGEQLARRDHGAVHLAGAHLFDLQPFDSFLALRLVTIAPRVCKEARPIRCLHTSPGPQLAFLCPGHTELVPSRDIGNEGLVRHGGQRREWPRVLVTGTELTEVVLTPAEHPAPFGERQRVLRTARHVNDALPLEGQNRCRC